MLPPPPPGFLPQEQVVRLSSVVAALAKLNVNIPIEDLLKAIRDEDEAKRVNTNTKEAMTPVQRRAALSKLALEAHQPTPGLKITTAPTFIPKPTDSEPSSVDPDSGTSSSS